MDHLKLHLKIINQKCKESLKYIFIDFYDKID